MHAVRQGGAVIENKDSNFYFPKTAKKTDIFDGYQF
jgi:hypothetical protein